MSGGGIPSSVLLGAALGGMTADMLDRKGAREAEDFPLAATEMAQFIPVSLKGKVGAKRVYTEQDVSWPYPFLMDVAKDQNESTIETPHVATGVVLKSASHVEVFVAVIGWHQDASKLFTGARVRFVVVAPGAPKKVTYDAEVHLTFSGYAAPSEDDTSNDTIFASGA